MGADTSTVTGAAEHIYAGYAGGYGGLGQIVSLRNTGNGVWELQISDNSAADDRSSSMLYGTPT